MRSFVLKFTITAVALLALHFGISLFVPAPLKTEYWVREAIIVKSDQLARMPSPRLILLGGSSVLFGIDASALETGLKMPVENFGLHASMSLERLLAEGEAQAKSGDIVLLALEPQFYSCDSQGWSGWQLENALAWDRTYFNSLPFWQRIKAVYSGGSPFLALDILRTRIDMLVRPKKMKERLDALAPPLDILARIDAQKTSGFSYSAANLDARGGMMNIDGTQEFLSPADVTLPSTPCPSVRDALFRFVLVMKHRGVRVLFAHAPYLVERKTPDWRPAEAHFAAGLDEVGGQLVDVRDEVFFPPSLFFNSPLHLNAKGRQIRTERLLTALRRQGL